jgi:hypothetical protein
MGLLEGRVNRAGEYEHPQSSFEQFDSSKVC